MNDHIRIALLEDDPIFLKELQKTLDRILPSLCPSHYETVAFSVAEALLKEIDILQPNLLIADIDLGNESLTGIDLAHTLQSRVPTCNVIYLTSYLHFATEIYKTKPLYFILKIEFDVRFPHAFSLFLQNIYSKQQVLSVVSHNIPATIPIDTILYCEHVGKNTLIHTKTNVLSVRTSIHSIFEKLPSEAFSQCHKSFIVGMVHIFNYSQSSITLKSGDTVPISRSNLKRFREDYTRWLATRI